MKNILLFLFVFAHYSYGQDTTLTKKQFSLLERLKNYRMADKLEQEKNIFDYSSTESFFFEDYQNPQIKKELMRLLVSKWTERELEAELTKLKREIPHQQIDDDTKRILKNHPKKSHKQVYDSLLNWRVNINREYYLTHPPGVNAEIIEMVGYIYVTEAIPLLQLKAKGYEAQLALARMEIEPYYTEFLNKYDPENVMKNSDSVRSEIVYRNILDLKYLGTQTALQKIEKWFYMDKKKIETYRRYSDSYANIARETVRKLGVSDKFPDLKAYVRKDELSKKRFFSIRNHNVTDEDIQYFKKYFKENKGKIKTNKYWY